MSVEQKPNPFDLQLDKIEIVEAVAKLGSISAASNVLGISALSIARGIRSVEESLDVVLFNPTPTGLVPTKFVIPFLKYGSQILHEVEVAKVDISQKTSKDLPEHKQQSLRIAAGMRSCRLWINEAARQVSIHYPDISISIDHDLLYLYRRLLQNDIDVGITMRVLLPLMPEGVKIQTLGVWRAYFVCRSGHPLTRLKNPNVADLQSYPLAGEYNFPVLMRILESGNFDIDHFKSHPDWLLSATHVDGLDQMNDLIKSSDHIAIMPYEVIADEIRNRDLAILDITEFRDLRLEVVFVYRKDDKNESLAALVATVRHLEDARHKMDDRC
ncbi:MAG: LysR family transcriptional regulator [Alphaproteobacteria bacterium]|nr:LysR family transcriptional regulator [Alphaproteobacteria bacterium]